MKKPGLFGKMMYDISRHRFLELKHFCLQYNYYKTLYLKLENLTNPPDIIACIKRDCKYAMELIEKTALDSDKLLGRYIFESVIKDVSYKQLNPPCNHDIFDLYRRKFFWLLNNRKGV